MIRLEEFLGRITCSYDGTLKPVLIYDGDSIRNPGDPDMRIMIFFQNNYGARGLMSKKFYNAEVKEICWMPDGIAVVVDMED